MGTAKTVKRPPQQPAQPQYANYRAPLTRKRHIPPHPAQSQYTNHWAPRTRKRHQQEHRPQRPTERSDPTQHAKGRTGDRPGPRKEAATRRHVTQGGLPPPPPPLMHPWGGPRGRRRFMAQGTTGHATVKSGGAVQRPHAPPFPRLGKSPLWSWMMAPEAAHPAAADSSLLLAEGLVGVPRGSPGKLRLPPPPPNISNPPLFTCL